MGCICLNAEMTHQTDTFYATQPTKPEVLQLPPLSVAVPSNAGNCVRDSIWWFTMWRFEIGAGS